jgi:hypothetical protein
VAAAVRVVVAGRAEKVAAGVARAVDAAPDRAGADPVKADEDHVKVGAARARVEEAHVKADAVRAEASRRVIHQRIRRNRVPTVP